jgi:tetratricopeptide (TPR) repeat protein
MRLCLNMIVRDERPILARCLRSVASHVVHYVVCDTGSTDGTPDLVREILDEAGVAGEIHSVPFRDFGQARNEALDLCRRSAAAFDYVLLLDADMELVVERPDFQARLSAAAYLMRQVSANLSYYNTRLLARQASARYVGVTHEYLQVEGSSVRLDDAYMLDHACGSSRPQKLDRDRALLKLALAENPDDARSLFYFAQTLREAGRHVEAIEAYRRRVALGGWDEEAWYARFMIARCHRALGDPARFVEACMEAYDARPSRAEPLNDLAAHYRGLGQHEACAMLCEAGLRIKRPEDLLFIEDDVYSMAFREHLSISGFYSKVPARRETGRALCAELSVERAAPAEVRRTARDNWRFYVRGVTELLESVRLVPLYIAVPPGYRACNPSLAIRGGVVWACVRSVNYVLDEGRYEVPDGVVRNRSWLVELDGTLRPRLVVPVAEDESQVVPDAPIRGIEDIRICRHGGRFVATGMAADRDASHLRRIATFEIDEDGAMRGFALQDHERSQHQKNWLPFSHGGDLYALYWTDPTVVLRFDASRRQFAPVLEAECALALEEQRGGAAPVPFDGGWLYVTHEVSVRDESRTYLHRFVHLDAEFAVRAASEPFCFRGLGVEYCCGLVAGPARGLGASELLLGFGACDGEAWLAVLRCDEVRSLLRPAQCGASQRGARS